MDKEKTKAAWTTYLAHQWCDCCDYPIHLL